MIAVEIKKQKKIKTFKDEHMYEFTIYFHTMKKC